MSIMFLKIFFKSSTGLQSGAKILETIKFLGKVGLKSLFLIKPEHDPLQKFSNSITFSVTQWYPVLF